MAKRLDNLQDIGSDYLIDNNIASSELGIFNTAASVIRAYLKLPESERIRIVLNGSNLPTGIADSIADGVKMKELLRKLSE